MTRLILCNSVLLMLIIRVITAEPVPAQNVNNIHGKSGDRIDFNEKLDYNKVKMTKLRLLLLGELFKHENALPSFDAIESQTVHINTKNCSCKNYPCKLPVSNEITTNYNRRNFYTSCSDFCCTKFKRSVSSASYNQLFKEHQETTKWNRFSWRRVAEMCGKDNAKGIVPYVMHRKGTEPLCTGVLLSSKVILTTARCVYDTSIWDLAVKIEHNLSGKGPQQETFKLIRKMVHSNFKPEDGQYSHDVALLVLDKELKIANNGCYMCLPSSSRRQSSSCYVPSFFRLNLLKSSDCDKFLQISDFQKNLYLNNGSFCAVNSNSDAPTGFLLGGQPCSSTENSQKEHVEGLLTRHWKRGTDSTFFAFVDVSQYVDWINLQLDKLYS